VSSTPVAGTPWCVVWTGDGRVFFYNPSKRQSVWECPEDLQGREDVTKLMQSAPEADGDKKKKAPADDAGADADQPKAKKKKCDPASRLPLASRDRR